MKTTIRFKFPIGFFIIFSVSFLILIFATNNILEKNNEATITREMKAFKKNSNAYIKQSFMISHLNNDKMISQLNNDDIYFSQIAKDTAKELRVITESEVCAYNIDGKLIHNTSKIKPNEYEDLINAISGSTSYVVRKDKNKTMVYFSYPVVIDNNKVGILRFIKDYSLLYAQSSHISEVVFYTALVVFIIAFIFSYLLSRNISIPLLKLNQAANKVAVGDLDVSLDIKRRDELGELTRNFNKMVKKISDQIVTIQKDRDSLIEINNYKKDFFDNVTHELKTPLTTILGYAEMIQENAFTDKEFFNIGINHIINESNRLHNMVLKLLELSKDSFVIEDELKDIDIGYLLKDTCEGIKLKAERYKNTILYEVNKKIYIYGNSDKLRQVFINIIDNAIKYGYSDSPIKVSVEEKGSFAEISITNNGDGIAEEHISQIFTPFYRIDKIKSRELGSCGLGLSISNTIIEKHKGKIEIVSQPYKETTVIVRLPLC
ncbi:sensor histidine kinase [Clostridium brassicae]|uniref:histidine kinase n=1 Tax=Clostridium brassicae TaxID=2999072 RepID=A0ABT4D8B9_9CLOT|nr:HAMP domain-containing sensor histidine kinase [Clostridium brassicae]MCY6958552.1 HAMP domain-containing sensor histidine kinase [Clostridium brassicae]